MNAPNTAVRTVVSDSEWTLRVDLAACYRLVAWFGWDDLVFTHISARVPGPEHHFLINPYGMLFDEIMASSLIKVDLDGRKVLDSPYDVNPAGFTIHGAIHAAREDAHCVLHVHSINGVAVSAKPRGVLPISQHSIFVLSSLAYHDYEGVALNEAEKPRLVRDLGDKKFLMLRNHGLLTVGASPRRSCRCICSSRRARFKCARRAATTDLSKSIVQSSTAPRLNGSKSRGVRAAAWRGRPFFADSTAAMRLSATNSHGHSRLRPAAA